MATGKVRMYNPDRGFGFIRSDDGEDFFFHITAIVDEQWEPQQGRHVSFDVGINPRDGRPRAERVEPA